MTGQEGASLIPWVAMALAYEKLPDHIKNQIASLRARHSIEATFGAAMKEGKPPQYHGRIGSIYYVKRLFPGVLLCVAITLAAIALERIEVFFVGQPYLEALVLAILLGLAVRTAWTPGSSWSEGITFSAKFVLEFAIVLLGASVSITMVTSAWPWSVRW